MAAAAQQPKNNRLGRGLASLIGDAANTTEILPPEGEQRLLMIDQIHPSKLNPRKEFADSDLSELASSIREKGLVQPLIVRPRKGQPNSYEIVAGERRWRASQLANIHTVPAVVRELTDQELLEFAIIENVQRADLNAIEEAQGYQELIESYKYTQDDLSKIIGKSRSHLANTLRLLKLPEGVQNMISNGDISAGHGRALVGRSDAEKLARKIAIEGLSVRDIEALTQEKPEELNVEAVVKPAQKDPNLVSVERELSDALGLSVSIKPGRGEMGVIKLRYLTLDQFESIRERLVLSDM